MSADVEPATILVVDDDEVFRRFARALLEREGHTVIEAADGSGALAAVGQQPPDLILLDIEMPDMSGFELLGRLRPRVDAPVIVVSGREAETERVLAFDLGADDYVVKPFLPREFAARVRTSLRRMRDRPASVLRFGALEIRLAAREVSLSGEPVTLTPREFDLLAYLALRSGRVIPRQQLIEEVWHAEGKWHDTATVTEHVRRLRLKIEADPSNPRRLRGVRNVGYCFEPS
jgi:DNA-binding response OmpR family regulator